MKLFEVAVKTPLRRLFTYESELPLAPGMRVMIPFRNSERMGIVWGETDEKPNGLKQIHKSLDDLPLFGPKNLEFYRQSAEYYGISLGELLHASIPKKVKEGGALLECEPKTFAPKLPELSEQQEICVQQILKQPGFSTHLLLGETGSGKTEVYLHLMKNILKEGHQVLFLVPEISLTPQLEDRLAERLGTRVSIFHSNIKESQRLEVFSRAQAGLADVFLGARSALFLPFRNLSLIVVDEEHDSSYKQSERGTYHARDLAILKSKILNIPIVLGSATPSMESYSRCIDQDANIYRLPQFYSAEKPQIEIIPLKQTWKDEQKSFITEALHSEIEECLSRKEQVLLFLNRRGSATQRICMSCGHQEACPHCSSSLTLHFDLNRGLCHLCGFQKPILEECTECKHTEFFVGGVGTKEVETQIQARFPEARVARLDRDQTQKKNVLAETLRDFAEAKLDILVGTQMISKGIDIPKLSLVGIILADQGWGVPDFRAMERSFQLLKQIVGRGGRRGQKSKCLIQTFFPEHPVFELLQQDDAFENFARGELDLRKTALLPPYRKFLLWTLLDKSQTKVESAAAAFVQRLSKLAQAYEIEVLGPMEAPLFRWKSQYRYQVLAKSSSLSRLSGFMAIVLNDLEQRPLGVKMKTDRDPHHFM